MRIIKYLFLLVLLSGIAFSIFIATQKGDFTVERNKIMNAEKTTLYSYAKNLKNWKEWNSIALEDPFIQITNVNNSKGTLESFNWEGVDGTGNLSIIKEIENELILQKMSINGNEAAITMSFKDTLGKTKISWKAKGEMSFEYKFRSALNGGVTTIFGDVFEKSLHNLDRKLVFESNAHHIKVHGLVKKLPTYYLAQTFYSTLDNIDKNTSIVFRKINTFCSKNEIEKHGKPFVIYHNYSLNGKIVKISFCIPIKTSIFMTEGSEIVSDSLPSFEAVKTTLKGGYSHKQKAMEASLSYFKGKNIVRNPKFLHLELFTKSKVEENNPSKWITDIYIPTLPKPVFKPLPARRIATPQETAPTIEEEIPSEL